MKYFWIVLFFLLLISNVSAIEFYIQVKNDNDYVVRVTLHGNKCYFDNGELGKEVDIPEKSFVEEYVYANESTCYMNIIEATPRVRWGGIVNDSQFILEVGKPIEVTVERQVPVACTQKCYGIEYIILAGIIIVLLVIALIVVIIRGKSEPQTALDKYPTGY